MRIIGYCRVSTENQKEEGTIEIQDLALQEYAEKEGIEIIETFRDEGVSGAMENRPGLGLAFNYLETHPEAEGLLIYKLDRLARDILIQEMFVRDLAKMGKRLISTKEPDLDSTDPSRKMYRQIMGVFSEYEKGVISMRLQAGRIRKARHGGYAGGSPAIGYRALRDHGDRQSRLRVDEAEGKIIRYIFSMRGDGETLQAIAETLNRMKAPTKRGGKWHRRTIKYILDNPVYRGQISYAGVENQGNHTALVPA